jgi:hypothetical protein
MGRKRRKGSSRPDGAKEERWGFDSGVHKFTKIPRPRNPGKNPFRAKSDATKPSEKQKVKAAPAKTSD